MTEQTPAVDANVQHSLAVAELGPVVSTAGAYAQTIDSIEIHDNDALGQVGDLVKDLQHYRRKIEDKRTDLVGPLNKTVKNINALFKAPRDQIDGLIAKAKRKMTEYITRQELVEKQRREAEAKEARERAAALETAAETAREQNAPGSAEVVGVIEEQAAQATQDAEKALTTRSAPTRGMKASVSTVKRWVGEVVDVREVCRSIAEGRLPQSLVSFSQSELNDMARAVETECVRDGIRYKQDISAGVR